MNKLKEELKLIEQYLNKTKDSEQIL